jgi:hypothetical protein
MDTSDASKHGGDKDLLRWQTKLLPLMAGSLIALGAIFFVSSLWQYDRLQQYFDPPKMELREELKRLQPGVEVVQTQEYRDWYVRALLEEMAMKRRYQQNSVVVQARVWTRLMGFLTGMVLVFSGCVFILGKLRENVTVSGDMSSAKWTLITSSPGVALAFFGSGLIAFAIYLPATVESSDSAVYLPSYAMVPLTADNGSLPAPNPMSPGENEKTARKAVPQALPPDVSKLMKQEAAKSE